VFFVVVIGDIVKFIRRKVERNMACPNCGSNNYALLKKTTDLVGGIWQPKRCKKCKKVYDNSPHKLGINPFGQK